MIIFNGGPVIRITTAIDTEELDMPSYYLPLIKQLWVRCCSELQRFIMQDKYHRNLKTLSKKIPSQINVVKMVMKTGLKLSHHATCAI